MQGSRPERPSGREDGERGRLRPQPLFQRAARQPQPSDTSAPPGRSGLGNRAPRSPRSSTRTRATEGSSVSAADAVLSIRSRLLPSRHTSRMPAVPAALRRAHATSRMDGSKLSQPRSRKQPCGFAPSQPVRAPIASSALDRHRNRRRLAGSAVPTRPRQRSARDATRQTHRRDPNEPRALESGRLVAALRARRTSAMALRTRAESSARALR